MEIRVPAARVMEIVPSNDGKKSYVTFLDREGQGKVKLVITGAFPYRVDDLTTIEGQVVGAVGQYGQQLVADLSIVRPYDSPAVVPLPVSSVKKA